MTPDIHGAPASVPVLEVKGLKQHFPVATGLFKRGGAKVFAVDGVNFAIQPGETLGLVGESGCGKSTVARSIMRLVEPTAGEVSIEGTSILGLNSRSMMAYRRSMQMVFQDPFSSLNPRMSAGDIVSEPLHAHGIGTTKERGERVADLFNKVGLRKSQLSSLSHQLSGGQRQRIGIARALALGPKVIIGDEPVSALDVSIQAQIINLLIDLQEQEKLAYLFIAHDLSVVAHISHHVAVMYLGRIVEISSKRSVFGNPLHPYTQALLSSVPSPNPNVTRTNTPLSGDVPSPINRPPGCHFSTRCPHVFDRCRVESPALVESAPAHWAACHLVTGISQSGLTSIINDA